MFQSKLLQGALCATAFLDAVKAVYTTSAEDIAAYPAFEAAM